jgi:hypothetical protein
MARWTDPTKEHEFKRVLGNRLKALPKQQSEMKLGKKSLTKSSEERRPDSEVWPPRKEVS